MTNVETVEVGVPVEVPVPSELLAECLIPEFPERATIARIQDLIAQLYTSLHLCENQRQAVEDRQPD